MRGYYDASSKQWVAPIIQLSTLAMWNLMTKRKVIAGNNPTLAWLQRNAQKQFEKLCEAPMPEFGYGRG
jgi:hypothetical protein